MVREVYEDMCRAGAGGIRMEAAGLFLCRTCVHAEDAGHLTRDEDLFLCRALLPPLQEYAASKTPEYVLVNGCAPACLEHYERDEAVFDAFMQKDQAWDEALDHPYVIGKEALREGFDWRVW